MAGTNIGLLEGLAQLRDEMSPALKQIGPALDGAKAALASFSGATGPAQIGVAAVGTAVGIVGASVAAFAGFMTAASVQVLHLSDTMQNLHDRTGMSAEALQELQFAGKDIGVTAEGMAAAFTKSEKAIAGIGPGAKSGAAALQTIGLSVSQLKALKPEEQFTQIVEHLGQVSDPATKAALSIKLLGAQGPLIASLGDSLKESMQTAKDWGLVLSDDQIKKSDALGDAIGRLQSAVEGLVNKFGVILTTNPAVMGAVEGLTTIVVDLSKNLSALSSETESFTTLMAEGFLIVVSAALTALGLFVGSVGLLTDGMIKLGSSVLEAGSALLKFAAGAAEAMGKTDLAKSLKDTAAQFDAWGKAGMKAGDTVGKATQAAAYSLLDAGVKAFQLSGSLTATGKAATDAALAHKKHQDALEAASKAAEAHAKAVDSLKEKLMGGGKEYEVFADAISDPKVLEHIMGNSKALESAAEQIKKFAEAGKDLTPEMQAIADKAASLDAKLKEEQDTLKKWADQLLKSAHDFQSAWAAIFGTAATQQQVKGAIEAFDGLNAAIGASGKTIEQMNEDELKNLESMLDSLYKQLKDSNTPEVAKLEAMLGKTRAALREFGDGVEQAGPPTEVLAARAKALAEALQKVADASVVGHIAHAFDEVGSAIQGLDSAMGSLGISSDNSFRVMAEGLRQVDEGAKQFAQGGLANMIAGLGQMAAGFMKSIDSASTFQRALGGMMAGANIGKQIGMLAGPMGAAWGEVIGGLIGMTIGIFHKPAWAKVGDEAGKMLGEAVADGMSKQLEKQIADMAKKLGISLHDAILLNLGKIADETGAPISGMTDQILEMMRKVADGTLPVKEGIEAIADALDKMTEEALSGSADAVNGFIQMTGQLMLMVKNGTIPAEKGIEMLGQAFDKLKSAAEAGNKAASDMMYAMIVQARAAGLEIAQISEYVKSELEKTRTALEHMPPIVTPEDAIAQASIFSAAFWATVKEEGLVAAATAFIPAWNAIKQSLQDAGIDRSVVESLFGSISPVMRLVQDSVTGPIVQGIDALNQALEGLSNSGYMTTQAFEGFEQQAQSMYDRLIAAGVAPEVALQAIAPLLQNIQDAAARYGMQIDANTQSLITQATQSGIAFSTDPQQQMIDALNQIVVLLGGTVPNAATTAANTITAGAQTVAAAYRAAGDAAVDAGNRYADNAQTSSDAAAQAYSGAADTMVATTVTATTTMTEHFSVLADSAGEDGEYVGVVWAQGIDEIAFHADQNVDAVGTAFEALADVAIEPANQVADAVGGIVDGLQAIPKAAQNAGQAIQNMPDGGGGGGAGGAPGGGGHYQQFAEGGTVHAPETGMPVEVHGTEHILTPEQLQGFINAGIAAGMASGGGGGETVLHNVITLEGRNILAYNDNASRRRQSRTHPSGVRRY